MAREISNPLGVIDELFARCTGDKPPSEWQEKAHFVKTLELENEENFARVPCLNDVLAEEIPPFSLVRYRCLVQDVFEPELYSMLLLDREAQRFVTTKYRETLPGGKDLQDLGRNGLGTRGAYYCVPLPGETPWAKAAAAAGRTAAASAGQSQARTKRSRDEDVDMADMEPAAEAAPQVSQKPRQKQDAESLRLCESIEILGVLCVDPSMANLGDAPSWPYDARSPSTALVPRLHGLVVRRLPFYHPALPFSPAFLSEARLAQAYQRGLGGLQQARSAAIGLLQQSLKDPLAAEYVLALLASRVYGHTSGMALGQWSLNISHWPEDTAKSLHGAVSQLVPLAAHLPLTAETLSGGRWKPRKDFEANRLVAGKLQLAPGTTVLLDEAQMAQGTLNEVGVRAAQALNSLVTDQTLQCDFNSYDVPIPLEVNCLFVSKGVSILKLADVVVPLQPQNVTTDMASVGAGLDAARFLLALITRQARPFSMPEEVTARFSEDFAQIRQEHQDVGQRTVHVWRSLARAVCLTHGEEVLSLERWNSVLAMERERLRRMTTESGIQMDSAASLYPSDVIARAKEYLAHSPKFGAYSHSKGVPYFRRQVANYVDRRDGTSAAVPPVDPEDIFLTDGASSGVKTVLEVMIDGPKDGLLIPIPQYPLYSAAITRLGGTAIGYELTEDYASGKGWAIDVELIEKKIQDFIATGGHVRGIAVINPGNPTSMVLTRDVIDAMVRLCSKYGIVILADEVYQDNIFREDREFISFRRAVHELNLPVELFSFHSMSKGYYGECGLRGGVLHLTNIDPGAADQIYKLFSMILCANTLGQALMASILNPPVPGDASYALFAQERSDVLANLTKKAQLVSRELNAMPGVQSLPIEGAMYAFPQVYLPERFLQEARSAGKAPDMLYCIKMLEATGVIVVPGSGFGQRNGTWHYRITILPEEEKLRRVLDRMKKFHMDFLDKYLSPGERAIEDVTPTPCLPQYPESLHKDVIQAHLKGKLQQEKPVMLLMLGGSGAGKGTFLKAMKQHGMDTDAFVMHGLDEYIQYLPEYKATVQNQQVVYKDAADACYSGAIPIAKAAQLEMIRKKQHVVYEETGKDLSRIIKRILPPFQEAGYHIVTVLVDNLADVAKKRSLGRFMKEGRFASDSYIE
ncbi:unnamed protein product, partial [Effrenium voratum]